MNPVCLPGSEKGVVFVCCIKTDVESPEPMVLGPCTRMWLHYEMIIPQGSAPQGTRKTILHTRIQRLNGKDEIWTNCGPRGG